MLLIAGDGDHGDLGPPVQVLVVGLGGRDGEGLAQVRHHGTYERALLLQRVHVREQQVELDRTDPGWHGSSVVRRVGDNGVVPELTPIRLADKASTDRTQLDLLLDDVHVGHIGFVSDAQPVVIPTAVVRDGDRLLAHGSTGSRWMRTIAAGAPACVAVTALDGVVVARSAFESSLHYRSAVLFGAFEPLTGTDLEQALTAVTEALVPGRTSELRAPTPRELAATMVLAMPLDRWSLKVSDGWPGDEPEDVAGPAWAGVVPLLTSYGTPVGAPDLAAGIEVPASVRNLT